jgi:branched-chain amino acid transport system permease protein
VTSGLLRFIAAPAIPCYNLPHQRGANHNEPQAAAPGLRLFEREGRVPHDLVVFLQQLFNALRISGIYALVALGITVIFGLTGIVKFSIGQLITLGAFLAFAMSDNGRLPFLLAVPLAALSVAALSLLLERFVFRATIHTPINGFIVSLGLILVLQNIMVEGWGTTAHFIPPVLSKTWVVGGVHMPANDWLIIWITAGLIASLLLILRTTKYGRAMRACAEDREAAALMGIPVGIVIACTFALGGGLAGIAGGLLGSINTINVYLGQSYLLKGFAVALVGGLGNIEGAVIAAVLVGLTETMAAGYLSHPEWRDGYTFGLMIIVLLIRPTGLFRAQGQLQQTLQ